MKLSVIIPVYNEKETILKILDKVQKVPIEKEIIIIDDGSNDGTTEILKGIKDREYKNNF
jgi:dolichol-phosphate mannosyltransferase